VLAEGASAGADALREWASAHVPEPAAAPRRVEVIDAIPVTAVGKYYKPELRRRAAEEAARDALAGVITAGVVARLEDGQVVITVSGAERFAVEDALGPFTFSWETV
jgi:fatty-acyl-CoA synthase